jgi:sarcosine oxidase
VAREVLVATSAYSGEILPKLRRSVLPVQSIQVSTEVLPPTIRQGVTPGGQVVSDTRRLLL